ncbi:hypothetical protein [Ferruginibacter albus]|uniref:hypothetical protein n=1 Tax=Ferruginibacter albus TaxID=2875540 RepID=UPI001CC40C93|nr:hypothetical protein [Ferruginibacter albus]UAY53495.1 hypothetical protein K9M53_07420 [Ferruginibacter albus]
MAENSPVNETVQPPKSNTRSVVVGVLIVALLATWGYIIYDKSEKNQIIQQKDNKNMTLSAEKDSLKKMYDEASDKFENLKMVDAKKDSTITIKDQEIAQQKARIQTILGKSNATKEELAEAKTLIASLNANITSYKMQVDSLQGANAQLTVEKQQVTSQRDVALKDLDSTKQVVKQREDVIDIGSTLHASNFSISGIDDKGNGKEKQTTNAKKVNKLRIAFDLDENLITPSGNKTLYVAITGPDGKTISVESLGSGSFTSREGQDVNYTQKIDVNYIQAKRQTVSFDWKQTDKFTIGDYKIQVYNNGFKIGEGVTHLKKGGLFG